MAEMISIVPISLSSRLPYPGILLPGSSQRYVPYVDLPYISSLGAFIHALLLRACTYLSVS